MSDFRISGPTPTDWQRRNWHDRLDWALLTGDDDLLHEALLDGEIHLGFIEASSYCPTHQSLFHVEDGCRHCDLPRHPG